MADKFIDQDETQIYGSYAAKRIRTRLVGLIPGDYECLPGHGGKTSVGAERLLHLDRALGRVDVDDPVAGEELLGHAFHGHQYRQFL